MNITKKPIAQIRWLPCSVSEVSMNWEICFVFVLTIFTEGLIWHLSQSSIRPSLYFSSIVKSRSNPFLESTSIKQWSFLLKEITGSFDGVRTYECQITSQTRYPLRRPSGQVSYMTCYSVHIFYQKMCFLNVCTWTTFRHLWIRVYVKSAYHVHTY